MEHTRGKIGTREFLAIAVFMIGTKVADDTPSLLYKTMENAAWMVPIIIGAISVMPIYLLLKLAALYGNKSLMDIITYAFGKYIGVVVLFILWLIVSAALILDTAIYTDIIETMYFPKTPAIIIYLVLMGVCAYGAKKGLEQIGSIAWAFFPYVKISLFIALILAVFQGNLSFLFPVFGPGKWEIIKESTMNLAIYADFLYLFFLIPYIKTVSAIRKGIWIALCFIVAELAFALITYVMLFDYVSVKLLNYPFHETIRYIQLGFLRNAETLFFPFWLTTTFVRFAVYLYLNAMLFGRLFRIKNFESVIPIMATLIVFIGIIPGSPTFTIFRLRELLIHFTTPVYFTLPLLLWMIALMKGDFRHENR